MIELTERAVFFLSHPIIKHLSISITITSPPLSILRALTSFRFLILNRCANRPELNASYCRNINSAHKRRFLLATPRCTFCMARRWSNFNKSACVPIDGAIWLSRGVYKYTHWRHDAALLLAFYTEMRSKWLIFSHPKAWNFCIVHKNISSLLC
jgi:hypothetical protein